MAHTNETPNYHLSQFVGTDIPNPLVDYNGDMEKIDTAIKNVADAEASSASDIAELKVQNGSETLTTTAQTLSGAVNELDGEVDDITTRLTSAENKITEDESTLSTAVSNISTLSGKVSAVETKVGSAVLVTTASDCSGAINELAGTVNELGEDVSKLNNTLVCKGLDVEIASAIADGVKTNKVLLDELFTAVNTYKASLSDNEKFRYSRFILNSGLYSIPLNNEIYEKADTLDKVLIQRVVISDTSIKIHEIDFNGNTDKWIMNTVDSNGFATTSYLNAAPEAGSEYKIYADIYEEF